MAVLPGKLQTQSFYAPWSPQATPLYEFIEFELQAGPLGPKALYVLFSDWLLPRQGKLGSRCFVLFPPKNKDKEENLWAENTQIPHRLQFSLINAILLELDTKLTMVSLWPLLRPSKYGGITWKVANTKFLCSLITTSYTALWIHRVWASGGSAGPKSSLCIIFGLIIAKTRQIG